MNTISDKRNATDDKEYLEVPEKFIDMFKECSLPVPPIPRECVKNLEQVGTWSFSTKKIDQRVVNLFSDRVFMEDLNILANVVLKGKRLEDILAIETETQAVRNKDSNEYYFACGITGYGLQGWRFHYILFVKYLRFFVLLPYGSVYGDNEAERNQISIVNDLIELCLVTIDNERENDFRIDVTVDADSCHWSKYNGSGELIKSSDSIHTLIDELQILQNSIAESPIKIDAWLRI